MQRLTEQILIHAAGLPEGTPMLRQACSAFADDGAIVFHEDVFRTGAVSFNLTRHARQPRES